ncbi:extracellular solute-binding protein [Xylanibacillus composti]|uniref:ABC transporter substrate-binding protein n=1 Tax=Xylanibacillus composti TaxID=1572762 RepID=A0A8J4M4H5_9BACL|nr:ABC transporter substrate-binding protein [Xylanibacillus composti]MDT9725711.1 extracellular solute-binding protein [Xylanibacillus composti]GIQ71150.1 ABC transporter substrate-binding protein [Xylanibacillus composti]
MNKTNKRVNGNRSISLLALLVSVCLLVTACAGNSSSPSPSGNGSSGGDPVELTWYMPIGPQKDLAIVQEEANQIIREKINATLRIMPIDFGSYEQKMNTMAAAGEAFDLVWTSHWAFNYVTNANKGAFYDITELFEQYAPKTKELFTPQMIEDAKVNGVMYAVPNYQMFTTSGGFVIQERFIEKYNLDVDSLQDVRDIIPFVETIKANEPDIVPIGFENNSVFWMSTLYGLYDMNEIPYRKGDPNFEVLILQETPEYAEYLKMAHEFNQKGYFPPSAATIQDFYTIQAKGNVALYLKNTLKPDGEINEKGKNNNNPVKFVDLVDQVYTNSLATMTAVSNTSRNPQKAVELIELVNTDRELYRLLTAGIEGKHFERLEGDVIRPIPDSGYKFDSHFIGNVTNGYVLEGQPLDVWEQVREINDNALVLPTVGFKFDQQPVLTELANIAAVEDEYALALNTGTLDPEQYLPVYIEKLRAAGSERVREEKQRQLDEWLVEQGLK